MKLARPEPESDALWAYLESRPQRVSSVVAWVEVLRAVRRVSDDPDEGRRAEAVLHRIGLVELTGAIRRRAARIDPESLRTLDAVHLATAIDLGEELGEVVAYDARLVEAAESAGIVVRSPGAAKGRRT